MQAGNSLGREQPAVVQESGLRPVSQDLTTHVSNGLGSAGALDSLP